jgi:hypothetical protein
MEKMMLPKSKYGLGPSLSKEKRKKREPIAATVMIALWRL